MMLPEMVRVLNKVRETLRVAYRSDGLSEREVEEEVNLLNEALVQLEHDAWKRGLDFGNGVAARERQRVRDLLLQVAADVDGKDRADGDIRYNVYPDPAIYNWER